MGSNEVKKISVFSVIKDQIDELVVLHTIEQSDNIMVLQSFMYLNFSQKSSFDFLIRNAELVNFLHC